MPNRSKNINMFLMDGEVTGIIKCTLSNWTGVIYKIPRIQLADLKLRDEMKQSGIYFLFWLCVLRAWYLNNGNMARVKSYSEA